MNSSSSMLSDRFAVGGVATKKRGRATPHRLVVLASGELDVVQSIGGLLYDRVISGWTIAVHLAECRDGRPLRILGVHAQRIDDDTTFTPDPWPDAVVVSATLHNSDERVQTLFATSSRLRDMDIAMWGGRSPYGDTVVTHRLSSAAMAF